MAAYLNPGSVGFSRRPNPHSAPFWEMHGRPRVGLAKEESKILKDACLFWGQQGPHSEWLQLASSLGKISAEVGLSKEQSLFFKQLSMNPGLMARLQPRKGKHEGTTLSNNAQLAGKYWRVEFPGFAASVAPAPQVLSAAEAKEMNLYYPQQPTVIMSAPLKVSSEFPSRPNANDPTSKLIRVLGLGCFEITEKIFQHLDYTSVAMLAQTCIGAARAVSDFYTLLDIGDRDFHGQEFLAEELDNLKIAGEIPDHVDWRGSKYVLLSQSHQAWDPTIERRPVHTYLLQAEGLCRALRSFLNHGSSIRHLTISRIPFFDLGVLEAVCDLCPNLEKCTVLKTEQIRFHDLAPFFSNYVAKHKKHVEFDIAPLFETGPRWSNTDPDGGPDSTYRKGTYGITHSDSGIKNNVAIVQFCAYTLFPALKAAGQEHMIYNDSSLLRQWLEAQALPQNSISRTITVFEGKQKCDQMIAESEQHWIDYHAQSDEDIPEYTRDDWPSALRQQVSQLEVEISFLMAKAMFGEDMWLETIDRCMYATNFRCLVRNYAIWGKKWRCLLCDKDLERMCFANSYQCEDCRLQRLISSETDHLKKNKRIATSKLGLTPDGDEVATLAQSNFPHPDSFFGRGPNQERVNIIQTKADFFRRVLRAPNSSLVEFFDAVEEMDTRELNAGPVGRLAQNQRDHNRAVENLHSDPLLNISYQCYRKAPTKEEYLACTTAGWTDQEAYNATRW